MDRDAIVAVAEDLEYLSSWPGDIQDPEIRRGTAVLRRLLVEDAYGAAWRATGRSKEPTLIAIDLDLMIGNHVSAVFMALACGANFRGLKTATFCMHKGPPFENSPPGPIRQDGFPFERLFTLSQYLKSTSGVVSGRPFNRREVIKYIANVKGGVHLSPRMRKQEMKLIERLGKAEKKVRFHNTDGILVQAVAIGQCLGGSTDAESFIAEVKVGSR